MYSSQTQQEEASFNDERAVITSELHAIVDNLQPDVPPQVEPPRRPFWQRTGVWLVPLCLIAFTIILMYNPRIDNCNGFKITYKRQVLCISNDADFFLFVENFTCDAIENGPSVMDSLVADEAALKKMKLYFDKHDFSIETQPVEAEVLRGMRGQYDSTSFCKNFTKACWNVGIRLNNLGQTDSACYYFKKINAWSWKDSVLSAEEQNFINSLCNKSEKPVIYPTADFVEGECCTINYDNIAFRSKPLNPENMRAVNNRTQTRKETAQSVAIDNQTLIGTLRRGDNAFFLGKTGAFFKIRVQTSNQIGYIATSYNAISTLIKGCNTSISTPKPTPKPTPTSVYMPPKALAKDAVLGFDLYKGDEISTQEEWQKAAKTYKFVYFKASEGTNAKDNRMAEFAEKATNVGLLKGVYHFYRLLDMDVEGQVNNFLSAVEYSNQQFELPMLLDIEPLPKQYAEPLKSELIAQKDTIVKNIKQFLTEIERRTYKRPIIYTTRLVWDEFLKSPEGFDKYLLWVADYGPLPEPRLPSSWKNYTFWQFTENGKVGGKEGYTINVFNGNYADFQRFIRESRGGQTAK